MLVSGLSLMSVVAVLAVVVTVRKKMMGDNGWDDDTDYNTWP